MTKADFLNKYSALAQQVGRATGIDPRIVLAQAALETGYGKSAPNFNLFGIKGAGSTQQTKEFIDGKMVSLPQNFRAYENAQQSFDDYAKLMSGSRYKGVRSGKTLQDQIKALQASGYATDPNYGAKVMKIAQGINLEGLPMAQQPAQQQPQGLIGNLLGGRGIGGALGLSDDMRDNLKMAILMGQNPQGFAPMVRAIEARGAERRDRESKQTSANVTADYLDSIGQEGIANLVRQQAIGGAEGIRLATKGTGTDTTDYKNYMAIKVTRPDLTFEQYMSEKDRKPLQSKGTYRYGDRVIGEVTFDPNTGEYFEVVDGQRQPIDISQARPITDATFAKAIPNYGDFVKLTDELSQDMTSMDRLQDYMKTIGNTNVGFQRLGDQMTASLKTLLSGIAGPEWTKLTKDELNAAVAKGQLQGLIGRFRIETVGGGVMTEQDALRIIANLGGDVNALQNPEIVAQQIETLFKGKYKSFENKRKRHDSAIDALYGGMGFDKIEEYEFDQSIFDLNKPTSEVSDAELLKGAQGLTGKALEQYLQSLSDEDFARLSKLMSSAQE